jgi:uncharacterized protein (TIGR00255 family)
MIIGMSGFGQAQLENSKLKVQAQVHTLNHRYLDCSVYMPEALRYLESDIKALAKKKIKRGKVNISLNVLYKTGGPDLNPEAVRSYISLANKLHKRFGIAKNISFAQLLSLPSVLEQKQKLPLNNTVLQRMIMALVNQAVDKTVLMRRKEGEAIYRDLVKRANFMQDKVHYIEKRLPLVFSRLKEKLPADELNSTLRGSDVSEELVRLKFHLANFCKTASAAGQESRGKELDFICQELQREINTLGAKVPDHYVSSAVVKIKSQLEKLREQLQNVE